MNSAYKRTKAFILSIVLFFGALFIIGCFVLGIKNLCSVFQRYEEPINRVYTKEEKVALTFDVAWGSENIEEILEILDKHNAKATFFLVGSWVDDNEELAANISEKQETTENKEVSNNTVENVNAENNTAEANVNAENNAENGENQNAENSDDNATDTNEIVLGNDGFNESLEDEDLFVEPESESESELEDEENLKQ